jgi:uncharacterized protein (UPF0332 family)
LPSKFQAKAGRLAHYAQFHAAQAFIHARTGKVAKTHRGVRIQFHKLAKSEPSLDAQLAEDLTSAYPIEEIADYQSGQASPITAAVARAAIE